MPAALLGSTCIPHTGSLSILSPLSVGAVCPSMRFHERRRISRADLTGSFDPRVPSLTAAAVQAPMVRAYPTGGLERIAKGAAGTVEPDRCSVRRDAEIVRHALKGPPIQFDAADQLGLVGLEGGKHIIHASADGLEEIWVLCRCAGRRLRRHFLDHAGDGAPLAEVVN